MAGAALAVHVRVVRGDAHGGDGRQQLDEHAVAVAFVGTEFLGAAAEGHDAAAGFRDDVFEDVFRVGGRVAVLVEGPAVRQFFLGLAVHLELAAGDDRGGGVEEEGIGFRRDRDGQRVTAEHGLRREGRDHDGFGVRGAEAHEAFLDGHQGIVAGDAVVVRVADGHDADAALLCLFDGDLHRLVADELAHAVVAFDDRRDGRLEHDFRFGFEFDESALETVVITGQTLHAVGLDTVHVSGQQDIRDDGCFVFGEPEVLERVTDELFQDGQLEIHMCHKNLRKVR